MAFGGSNEIDLIDVAALIFIPWIAGVIFGVWSFDIEIFGGYNLMDPIWTLGGADISAGLILVVFGLAWIVATNELYERSDMDPVYLGLVLIAFASPVMFVFVPAFESFVTWSEVMQLGMTVLVSFAAVVVSFMN